MSLAFQNAYDEAIPVFSPSQSTSKEQVLHSIFSPDLKGGITSVVQNEDKHDVMRQHAKREKIRQAARRLTARPPSPLRKNVTILTSGRGTKTPASRSQNTRASVAQDRVDSFHRFDLSPEYFFTPSGPSRHLDRAQIVLGPSCVVLDAGLSPSLSKFDSPISTISALSNASAVSFKSLPIDMLSFDFVSNCQSAADLNQIVEALSSESPRHYPSLLRTAKKRLQSVNATINDMDKTAICRAHPHNQIGCRPKQVDLQHELNNQPANSSPHNMQTSQERGITRFHHGDPRWFPVDSRGCISNVIERPTKSSLRDESSLVMSLSSSHLQDDDGEDDTKLTSSGGDQQGGYIPVIPERFDWSGRVDAEYCCAPSDQAMKNIELTTENAYFVEALKYADEMNLLRKIQELDEAKKDAENTVATLEKAVTMTSAELEETMRLLALARSENQVVRDNLRKERETGNIKLKEAYDHQEGLIEKMDNLSAELARSDQKFADAKWSIEQSLRQEHEVERSRQREDIKSLNQALDKALLRIKSVQTERSDTLRTILYAMGKSAEEAKDFSQQDRNKILDLLAQKLGSSRAATKALSKALSVTESERRLASEARIAAEEKLKEMKSISHRLENENTLLIKKVQELSEELESSKAYIDTLLRSRNEGISHDWVGKEEQYKMTIKALRLQIRNGEAMVSMALYRNAVNEARSRAVECDEKRLEISGLKTRILSLERRLGETNASQKIIKQGQGSIRDSRESRDARKVTPTQSDENRCPQTPKLSGEKSSLTKDGSDPVSWKIIPSTASAEGGKISHRMVAVREAGGRAGLRAKLKQMRRSPLCDLRTLTPCAKT